MNHQKDNAGTVLVIDDEPDLRKILEINLSHLNYKVLTAENGAIGINMAHEHRPGLIILDMMMPEMDGNEVCAQLQSSDKTRGIPILILTAKENMETKLEALKLGAVDYITKPFEMSELTARISSQFKIQNLYKEVQQYAQKMEADLEVARQVQKSILPHRIPYLEGVSLAAIYTATEMVGGDYYDIIQRDASSLSLLVSDVSGHGIPAAFITAMAKISFKNALKKEKALHEVLEEINSEFHEIIRTEHYLTAFLCNYDIETRHFSYSKAGHINQLLYRSKKGKCEELETEGFFIGTFDKGHYETKSAQLDQGDILVLFTDGLVECKNTQSQHYGIERLKSIIEQNYQLDAASLVKIIMEDQNQYIKDQSRSDDFSLLIMNINPASSCHQVKQICNIEDDCQINFEPFESPLHFGESLEKIFSQLEFRGYTSKFLREARISLTIALNNFQKGLSLPHHNLQMLWMESKDKVHFILYASDGTQILTQDKNKSIEALLSHSRKQSRQYLERVFDSLEFFNSGNILRLSKAKTPKILGKSPQSV